MKRNLFISFFLIVLGGFISCFPLEGQIRQVGYVTIQNSGKSPLSGVQVRAAGAIPASSDIKGNFTLSFGTSKAGELLLLEDVYKEGYELVNRRELERWALSPSRTVPIVMCPEGTLLAAQEKYYEIGKTHNIERYANTCKMLDEQLAKNQITIDEYNLQLDRISKEYQHTMEQLEAYAYNMACYNRDDLDKMSQNALSLVEAGQIEKALSLYTDINLSEYFVALGKKEELINKDQEMMISSLHLNADLCLFAGGEKNIMHAGNIYESIAMSDTTNAAYATDYAMFLIENRADFDKAIPWFQRALRYSSDSLLRAEIYSGLGMIMTYKYKQDETYSFLSKADTIYKELLKNDRYKNDPIFNASYVANIINENRYRLSIEDNKEALTLLFNSVPYALKACEADKTEYSYLYAFVLSESVTACKLLISEYGTINDKNLELIISMAETAQNVLRYVSPKMQIKSACLKAELYNELSSVMTMYGLYEKSEAYADSCRYIVDAYENKNPMIFSRIDAQNLVQRGMNRLKQEKYRDAADLLFQAYLKLKEMPYYPRLRMQVLHQLLVCSMVLRSDDVLRNSEYALQNMRKDLDVQEPFYNLEVYLMYVKARTDRKVQFKQCEEVLSEMFKYINKTDPDAKLFENEVLIDMLVSSVIIMYRGNKVTTLSKRNEILRLTISVLNMHYLSSNYSYYLNTLLKLWEEKF